MRPYTQALRFGLYPSIRDALTAADGESQAPSGADMAAAGLLTGAVAYLAATPLWLVKTRAQAHAASSVAATARLLPATLPGAWRGCTPLVIRGACLSSGQMLGYDGP